MMEGDSSDEEDVQIDLDGKSDKEIQNFFDQRAQEIANGTVPPRSKIKYEQCYDQFELWQTESNTKRLDESVFMVYFCDYLAPKYSPPTLWSKWSMLNTMLRNKCGIRLDTYARLKGFVKMANKDYKPKQAPTFSLNQIKYFIQEASDDIYLAVKVQLSCIAQN